MVNNQDGSSVSEERPSRNIVRWRDADTAIFGSIARVMSYFGLLMSGVVVVETFFTHPKPTSPYVAVIGGLLALFGTWGAVIFRWAMRHLPFSDTSAPRRSPAHASS